MGYRIDDPHFSIVFHIFPGLHEAQRLGGLTYQNGALLTWIILDIIGWDGHLQCHGPENAEERAENLRLFRFC